MPIVHDPFLLMEGILVRSDDAERIRRYREMTATEQIDTTEKETALNEFDRLTGRLQRYKEQYQNLRSSTYGRIDHLQEPLKDNSFHTAKVRSQHVTDAEMILENFRLMADLAKSIDIDERTQRALRDRHGF